MLCGYLFVGLFYCSELLVVEKWDVKVLLKWVFCELFVEKVYRIFWVDMEGKLWLIIKLSCFCLFCCWNECVIFELLFKVKFICCR